jgi:hypothetical protein
MLKVYADFNSGTTDGALTILFYKDRPLEAQMPFLKSSRRRKGGSLSGCR